VVTTNECYGNFTDELGSPPARQPAVPPAAPQKSMAAWGLALKRKRACPGFLSVVSPPWQAGRVASCANRLRCNAGWRQAHQATMTGWPTPATAVEDLLSGVTSLLAVG